MKHNPHSLIALFYMKRPPRIALFYIKQHSLIALFYINRIALHPEFQVPLILKSLFASL